MSALPRWYRKLIFKNKVSPPAILVVAKNSPRGLFADEIALGLKQSKDEKEPARIRWEA